MRDALKEALTTKEKGPKVLIAQSECMLNKQRREKPLVRKAIADGKRVVREKFGVDSDTCTGDHSCIRLSGCPSLSIKPNPDPLRTDPVATVLDSCVGCGVCGEVSHAAVLCPSFYKAQIVSNPSRWDRLRERVRGARHRLAAARRGASAARALRVLNADPDDTTTTDQDRDPRHGRRGRRRAGRLDRRPGRGQRLHRADHLGAGRGPAHRRHHLLRRAVSRRRRPRPTAASRCWR